MFYYFPDKGCVRTLCTLYVYVTVQLCRQTKRDKDYSPHTCTYEVSVCRDSLPSRHSQRQQLETGTEFFRSSEIYMYIGIF